MKYTNESHICSMKDVKAFFHHIVIDRKVKFHPDNMFEESVSYKGVINTFSFEESSIYNRLMDESFSVCENNGVDIYGIGLGKLHDAIEKMLNLW